ncbi:MYXO-CTERM sorting domain-containing protein [Nannocystaceae bacterium ST9]
MRRAVLLSLPLVLAPGLALAGGLVELHVQPSERSAAVVVETIDMSGNETLSMELRGPADADYRPVHRPIAYETGAAAGVLFDLAPDTTYDLRVSVDDPDGITGQPMLEAQLTTQAAFALPTPLRIFWIGPGGSDAPDQGTSEVAPFATIDYAIGQAQPGDELRVLPGDYGPVDASGLTGSEAAPIVILGFGDRNMRPRIDAAGAATSFDLTGAAHVIVSGLEITGAGDDEGGSGVRLHSGSHLTIHDCFVHDNGHWEILVSKGAEYSGGILQGGYHRILNSEIADLEHESCEGASNDACPGQSYYGVNLDNNPGAGVVIAGNTIHGVVDGVSICGNESEAREMPAEVSGVLAQTGGGLGWTNWGVEVHHNEIFATRDDAVEADGICVAARVWRNDLHDAENPISIAPIAPGPIFLVRNLIHGSWGQGAFKLNTDGGVDSQSRHVFAYHNTAVREDPGTLVNLWYALAGEHSVPIHDYVFRNNVLSTPAGRCTDALNEGSEHPSFDGDLWWSPDPDGLFQWWDGAQTQTYADFASFTAATGQEGEGQFGEPMLAADFAPIVGSPAIDQALPLAGINDAFAGVGPDVGAFELDGGETTTTGDGDGDSTGDGDSSGDGDSTGDGEGTSDTGSGDELGADEVGDAGGEGGSEGGCSCSTEPEPSAPIGAAMLLLGLSFARRRRA